MSFMHQVIGLARDYKKWERKHSGPGTRAANWLLVEMQQDYDAHAKNYFAREEMEVFLKALVKLCETSTPTYKSKTPRLPRPKYVEKHILVGGYMCARCSRYCVAVPGKPLHCAYCEPCSDCKKETIKFADAGHSKFHATAHYPARYPKDGAR
jgi:hypothetical protein